MSDAYMAQVTLFAGNFAPKNWMFCNGQILGISQFQALFALLGTTYGGNGVSTFALPDLRGRVAVSAGAGPGLSTYTLGQQGGTENVTLLTSQMPQHNHNVLVNNASANVSSPTNAYISELPGTPPNVPKGFASALAASTTLNNATIQSAGNSASHPNLQPLLALNYIICVFGIYPPRN